MRRTLLDYAGAFLLMVLLMFIIGASDHTGESEFARPSMWSLFKCTGLIGILVLYCLSLGSIKLLRNRAAMAASKLADPGVIEKVRQSLDAGDGDRALAIARADSTYAGKVLAGALARRPAGKDEMMKGLEQSAAVESALRVGGVTSLLITGIVALLLGFLGTASGMMNTFRIIEMLRYPTPADAAVGIYEALVTSMMGILAAVIFVPAYFALKRTLSTRTLRIDADLGELLATAR